MRKFSLFFLIAVSIAHVSILHAHPVGTRFWGHRFDVKLRPDAVQIDYVIEVPVSKLSLMMNRYRALHKLETIVPADEKAFRNEFMDYLEKRIEITVNGKKAPLAWNPNYIRESGVGDAGFFEYRLHLITPIEAGSGTPYRIEIYNSNYEGPRTVFNNRIQSLPGVHAENISVPGNMGWEEDERNRRLSFNYVPGDAPQGLSAEETGPAVGNTILRSGSLLDLLRKTSPSADMIWIALVTALLLGALHALSPGHGKALVAAYLVGNRGTVSQAIALGAIVTATHISSVVILGLIGLAAAHYIVPEYYSPFINLASGIMIVCIGAWLFIRRLLHQHQHHHHEGKAPTGNAPSRRALLAMGIAGGIVPCPSAMAVMLTAIAIGRAGLGLALIVAFSIGLATVLTALGVLTVKTSKILNHIPHQEFFARWLPVGSAVIVTILGIVIIYEGFWVVWMLPK